MLRSRATLVGFCKEIFSLLILSKCPDSRLLDILLDVIKFAWLWASIMNCEDFPFFWSSYLTIYLNEDEKYWKLEFLLLLASDFFLDLERGVPSNPITNSSLCSDFFLFKISSKLFLGEGSSWFSFSIISPSLSSADAYFDSIYLLIFSIWRWFLFGF